MTGADWVVNPGFLIGAFVQLDWTREQASANTAGNGGQALQGSNGLGSNGQGWMAGPYLAAKLTPNLVFDARAAVGQSNNKLVTDTAGEEAFSTDRSLLFGRLSGYWSLGAWRFTPSIAASYYRETQKAMTTSDGVSIPSQSLTLGRVSFGPEIGYAFKSPNGTVFEPLLGIKGLWDFATDNSQTAASAAPAGSGLRFSLELGAQLKLPSGVMLRGTGSFEGLGDNHLQSYHGQASVTVPLN